MVEGVGSHRTRRAELGGHESRVGERGEVIAPRERLVPHEDATLVAQVQQSRVLRARFCRARACRRPRQGELRAGATDTLCHRGECDAPVGSASPG
eukprot:5239172-Prymnesium_polylepis.1